MRRIRWFFLFLFLLVSVGRAATYYVNQEDGNDSWDGSQIAYAGYCSNLDDAWDFEGNLRDFPTRTNDLTASGPVVYNEDNEIVNSRALQLGGASYVYRLDDSLSAGFPWKSGSSDVDGTILIWVRPTTLPTTSYVIWSKGGHYCSLVKDGSDYRFQVTVETSAGTEATSYLTPTTTVAVNRWYHVGFAVDADGGYLFTLYDNTAAERVTDDTTAFTGPLVVNASNWNLGADSLGTTRWTGLLDGAVCDYEALTLQNITDIVANVWPESLIGPFYSLDHALVTATAGSTIYCARDDSDKREAIYSVNLSGVTSTRTSWAEALTVMPYTDGSIGRLDSIVIDGVANAYIDFVGMHIRANRASLGDDTCLVSITDSSHIKIRDGVIWGSRQYDYAGSLSTTDIGVYLHGDTGAVSNIFITGNDFRQFDRACLVEGTTGDSVEITGNTFYDIREIVFDLAAGSGDVLVADNALEMNLIFTDHPDGVHIARPDVTLRSNRFSAYGTYGLWFDGTTPPAAGYASTTIESNLWWGSDTGSILIDELGHNFFFRNNTFVSTWTSTDPSGDDPPDRYVGGVVIGNPSAGRAGDGIVIQNNIIVGPLDVDSATFDLATPDKNIVWTLTDNGGDGALNSYLANAIAVNSSGAYNEGFSDTYFETPGTLFLGTPAAVTFAYCYANRTADIERYRSFQIASGSIAEDAAGSSTAETDFYGRTRSAIDAAADIGAFELGTSIPTALSTPSPVDEGTGIGIQTLGGFSIGGGTGVEAYDCYWGTDSTPDETEFDDWQTALPFATRGLEPSTTYYWRITAWGKDGYADSGVCSFTTRSAKTIYVDNTLGANITDGTYDAATRGTGGTDGDAYMTPQAAADVAEAGDTIRFRSGVHGSGSGAQATPVMLFTRSGTAAAGITLTDYDGDTEEAILDAWREGTTGKHNTVELGIEPDTDPDESGDGVEYITVENLVFEGASEWSLILWGPANRFYEPDGASRNITVQHCTFRYNAGGNGLGGGFRSVGRITDCLVEHCEAHSNTGTGFSYNRLSKQFNGVVGDDAYFYIEDEWMSGAVDSTIRHCLSYRNINLVNPGNCDGLGGASMYHCTIQGNILFANSDDGMDIYSAIECTIKDNLVFDHYYIGGNNAGIKFSAGGGGRHTVMGNVVCNNRGLGYESSSPSASYRIYYPSKHYHNTIYNNKTGITLGSWWDYTIDFPGYEKSVIRNFISFGATGGNDINNGFALTTDSDYNLYGSAANLATQQGRGLDAHSLSGDPALVNKDVDVDDVDEDVGAAWAIWTIEEKLAHVRNLFAGAFALAAGSQCLDAGVVVDGLHNASPGDGEDRDWYDTAPDMGVYEDTGEESIVPDKAASPSPADGATVTQETSSVSCAAASGALYYRFYLDNVNPPLALIGTVAVPTISTDALVDGVTYYWRVDTINGENITTGDVWSFTLDLAEEAPAQATTPFPADGATGVSLDVMLSWLAVAGVDSYSIYFDDETPLDGTDLIGTQAGTSIEVSSLDPGTTYYWRVDTTNQIDTTTGTEWSFTTVDLGAPTLLSPTDEAVRVATTVALTWSAVDGADDYAVYFAESPNSDPEEDELIAAVTGLTYSPPDLRQGVTYYWRVAARLETGEEVSSGLWSFTTRKVVYLRLK